MNKRGFYFYPLHDRKEDWEFLSAWQPQVVRLMLDGSHTDPMSVDLGKIIRTAETAPDSTVLLRVWDVDDRNGEAKARMVEDPQAAAVEYHDWFARLIDRLPLEIRVRTVAGSINEPQPEHFAAVHPFSKALLDLGNQSGHRFGVFCWGPGLPPLVEEGLPWGWQAFMDLEPAIVAGNHIVVVHEYFQPEGIRAEWIDEKGETRRDYGYLVGRNLKIPLSRANILIGEWGIDGLLYNRHKDPRYGHNGWLGFGDLWPPERYADEYVTCIQEAKDNVMAICPFISDFGDHTWQSFDLKPAYPALLAVKHLTDVALPVQRPEYLYMPYVSTPPHIPSEPDMKSNWEKAILFVLGIEGGYVNNPADPGGETKFGISKAAHPELDIPNLTLEQAKQIYFREYWVESGADKLSWPMCLVHFDTYVQNKSVAPKLLMESKGDSMRYLIKRLRWYRSLKQWPVFGSGWTKRVLDLMDIVNDEKDY